MKPGPETAAFLLLAAALCARQLYAESTADFLARAEALSSEGKSAEALSAYRAWLLANRGSENYGVILLRAASATPEAGETLRLLAEFTPSVEDAQAKADCLQRQILLLRLLGRVEEALSLCKTLPETPGNRLELAVLFFEQGMLEEAEGALTPLLSRGAAGDELEARAHYLLARIRIDSGSLLAAENLLGTLVESYPAASIVPAALLARCETAALRGERKQALTALEALERRFPESPEYALALRQVEGTKPEASFRYAPTPGRLLAAIERPVEPAVSEPERSEPQAVTALVQVGSFRDPENARYLVRDLKNKGFAATIVEKSLNADRYFRVVIGPEPSADKAQSLLLRLKDAGFEGVLLLQD